MRDMRTAQVSARIDASVMRAMQDYCRSNGIVMKHFIQEAILDRLDELADIEEIERLRLEPTRPFSEVLAEFDPVA